MREAPLLEAFLAALPHGLRARLGGRAALEEQLAEAVRDAAAAWPALPLDPRRFAAHLGARVPESAELERPLAALRTTDLHLACACACAVTGAAEALEAFCLDGLHPSLAGLGLDAGQVEEVKQTLRARLLVAGPGDEPPAISRYSGRGPLPAWVRVVGLRIALKLVQRGRRELPLEEQLLEAMPPASDPELRFMKDLYRGELREAFQAALRSLVPRDANILLHHYVDGMTTHEIGALYRVHQTTAARWLERARVAILAATRSGLEQRMGAHPDEVESIMRLCHSRLDLTLRGLLER